MKSLPFSKERQGGRNVSKKEDGQRRRGEEEAGEGAGIDKRR